ncbi:unnamed protein product [Effrenium voratum]|nr:unnamed protein product [Effrenium voratum]
MAPKTKTSPPAATIDLVGAPANNYKSPNPAMVTQALQELQKNLSPEMIPSEELSDLLKLLTPEEVKHLQNLVSQRAAAQTPIDPEDVALMDMMHSLHEELDTSLADICYGKKPVVWEVFCSPESELSSILNYLILLLPMKNLMGLPKEKIFIHLMILMTSWNHHHNLLLLRFSMVRIGNHRSYVLMIQYLRVVLEGTVMMILLYLIDLIYHLFRMALRSCLGIVFDGKLLLALMVDLKYNQAFLPDHHQINLKMLYHHCKVLMMLFQNLMRKDLELVVLMRFVAIPSLFDFGDFLKYSIGKTCA